MKLNRIADRVYYIDAAVNMGVIAGEDGKALLVDTGIDDSVARKVLRVIEAGGLTLESIVITHAHADHCGGAPHLVKVTGARVFAPEPEKSVLEFPLWEPAYLFSGAYPPPAMQNKFLLAPGVRVDGVIVPGKNRIGGIEVEIVDLAGHSLGQAGVSAGGVLFCADSVIGPGVVEKHGIPLNTNLAAAIRTYDLLLERPERVFVPAHGSPAEDIGPVVEANRTRVEETLSFILSLLEKPMTAEIILAEACSRYGINISGMIRYYLMNHTVMAYISYLLETGLITAGYEDNRQVFFKV